jgi:DeoR/GlpR family transcriptional regulator of sugar metabolism
LLSVQRRKEIFHLLTANGQVELQDLASRFGVSIMTIRRDLERLEQEGKARRVHGGAILAEQKWIPDTIETKSTTNIERKQAVARKVLDLLRPNSSIFLDAGSTGFEVAKQLSQAFREPLTICTPDLHIADLLAKEERFEVYACGGRVDGATSSAGGAFALQMIRSLHADLALIGCDGLTIKDGAMSARMEQLQVKQAMMEHSLQSALMVDSSKFGRVSFVTIAPLSTFDYVISDDELGDSMRESMKKAGVELM